MSVGFCNNQLSSLENIGQICIKSGKSGLPIPNKVAKSMINLITDDWFDAEPYMNGNTFDKDAYTESHRVIDICCNSGVLLEHFYYKFMQELNRAISNSNEREDYILQNLLYAFCLDSKLVRLLRMRLYWSSKCKGHIYQYNIVSDTGRDLIRARSVLESMKFDVVVGNPPYNNDMYLDFVMLGHRLAKTYDLWITPAKFVTTADDYRAKSSISYKDFRELILGHISDLCFYPDALDLFNISQVDGIAYYIATKDNVKECNVINKSIHNEHYNSRESRDIVSTRILFNKGANIVKSLGNYISFKPSKIDKTKFNKVVIGTQFVTNGCGSNERKAVEVGSKSNIFNSDGEITVVSKGVISNSIPEGTFCCAFSSDNINECNNFIYWLNTKFVRFLVLCNISKLTGIYTDDYWKFVPDPGSFNRIFEDKPLEGYIPDENGEYIDSDGNKHCSLYVKYKLTQQEMNIIESVIRERK